MPVGAVGMPAVPWRKPGCQTGFRSSGIRSLPLARPCKATGQAKYNPNLRGWRFCLYAARWPRTGCCGVSPLERGGEDARGFPVGKTFPHPGIPRSRELPSSCLNFDHMGTCLAKPRFYETNIPRRKLAIQTRFSLPSAALNRSLCPCLLADDFDFDLVCGAHRVAGTRLEREHHRLLARPAQVALRDNLDGTC